MTRRQDRQLLQRLGVSIPRPFTVDVFAERVAAARGRDILLTVEEFETTLDGLAVSTARTDHVVVTAGAAPIHQIHIATHEIAHILRDDRCSIPTGDGSVIHRHSQPHPATGQDGHQERRAESMAATVAEIAARRASVPALADLVLRTRDLVDWLTYRAAYRRLYPLWRALREAHLHSGSPTHAPPLDDRPLPLRHAYRAVYERVIEIHDGLRLARNHVNPAVVGLARQLALQAGCTAEMANIVAFGSGIAVWLDTRRHNAVRRFPNSVDVPAHHTASGLRQQARLLTAVAHAFSQAPLVGTDRYRSASVLRRLSLRAWSRLRHPTHVARAVVPSAGTTPTGGAVGPAVRHPDRRDNGGEPRPEGHPVDGPPGPSGSPQS